MAGLGVENTGPRKPGRGLAILDWTAIAEKMSEFKAPTVNSISTYIPRFCKGSGYSSGTRQIASEANRPVPDE